MTRSANTVLVTIGHHPLVLGTAQQAAKLISLLGDMVSVTYATDPFRKENDRYVQAVALDPSADINVVRQFRLIGPEGCPVEVRDMPIRKGLRRARPARVLRMLTEGGT